MGNDDIRSREVLERHVVAQVIAYIENNPQGDQDGITWALKVGSAFPGLPAGILDEAMYSVQAKANERWWDALQDTVGAEIVKRAMSGEAFAFAGLPVACENKGSA